MFIWTWALVSVWSLGSVLSNLLCFSARVHLLSLALKLEIHALQIPTGNYGTTHSFRKNKSLLALVYCFLLHAQAYLPEALLGSWSLTVLSLSLSLSLPGVGKTMRVVSSLLRCTLHYQVVRSILLLNFRDSDYVLLTWLLVIHVSTSRTWKSLIIFLVAWYAFCWISNEDSFVRISCDNHSKSFSREEITDINNHRDLLWQVVFYFNDTWIITRFTFCPSR